MQEGSNLVSFAKRLRLLSVFANGSWGQAATRHALMRMPCTPVSLACSPMPLLHPTHQPCRTLPVFWAGQRGAVVFGHAPCAAARGAAERGAERSRGRIATLAGSVPCPALHHRGRGSGGGQDIGRGKAQDRGGGGAYHTTKRSSAPLCPLFPRHLPAFAPSVLLLDEPLSGLDSHSCKSLLRVLRCAANRGCAVVMSIHQPSAAVFDGCWLAQQTLA